MKSRANLRKLWESVQRKHINSESVGDHNKPSGIRGNHKKELETIETHRKSQESIEIIGNDRRAKNHERASNRDEITPHADYDSLGHCPRRAKPRLERFGKSKKIIGNQRKTTRTHRTTQKNITNSGNNS